MSLPSSTPTTGDITRRPQSTLTYASAVRDMSSRITGMQRSSMRKPLNGLPLGVTARLVVPQLPTTTTTYTSQNVFFIRFTPQQTMTIRLIQPFVSTAGTATNSTFRVGLYDSTGTKIGDSSNQVKATNAVGLLPLYVYPWDGTTLGSTAGVQVTLGQAYYAALLISAQSGSPAYAAFATPGAFWNPIQYDAETTLPASAANRVDILTQGSRTTLPSDMTSAVAVSASNASVQVPALMLAE